MAYLLNTVSVGVKAKDFVQIMPYNGRPSFQTIRSECFLRGYDLFIRRNYSDDPDCKKNYITTRDNIGVADYLGFLIDPKTTGLLHTNSLFPSPTVQTDLKEKKKQ
jgi:hypothetical protein